VNIAWSRRLESFVKLMCPRIPSLQVKQPKSGHDDKNQLSQCKELWLFWYGEKPVEQLRTLLVSDSLKEITESSGSWEAGIPYEARTLLFKALNNLIERNLLSREFVRIGKWFVQPFEGGSADRPAAKTSHLRQVSGSHCLSALLSADPDPKQAFHVNPVPDAGF
jgi:hypothetical protein